MALPELVKKAAERIMSRYCLGRVTPSAQEKSRLGFRIKGDHVTLFEEKAAAHEPGKWFVSPVVQFRFNQDLQQWTLYYPDQHKKWHAHNDVAPNLDLRKLLNYVSEDPQGQFWE